MHEQAGIGSAYLSTFRLEGLSGFIRQQALSTNPMQWKEMIE